MSSHSPLPDASLSVSTLHVSLDYTLGAVFLGGFFSAILYGIMCLQIYIFFNRFTEEKQLLKYSVAVLWGLSTFHMALVIHPLYILLIKDFAHPLTLLKVPWTIVASAMATCITDAIVRSWFTYRIWILGNKRWAVTGSLAVLIVAAFITGIWVNSEAFKASQVLSSFDKTAWLFYTNFALSLTADIYIAVCLCYQLYRRKASYNSRSTNSMLNFLMVYAVNTGLLTAIINLGSLITHAVMPGNYVFLGIFFMLGPLYVNALMGSLNARDWFRQSTSDHITIPLSTLHVSPPSDDASTRDGYYHDHSRNLFKPGRHAVVVTKDKHVEVM